MSGSRCSAGCSASSATATSPVSARRCEQMRDGLPYYQCRNEQAMVHTAAAYAKMQQPPADVRLHVVDRTGRDQHGDRRRGRHDQPPAGAAAARRHLRAAARAAPGAPAAGVVTVAGHLGQRLLQAGVALLGPHQPPGAAAHRAARSDARADLARRDRRRHAGAAAGRAGRGLRLSRRRCSRSASGRFRASARDAALLQARRRGDSREPPTADRRRRRCALQRSLRRLAPLCRARPASRSSRRRPARARWPGTTRWRSARWA